jgi:hypothetical protein
MSKRPRTSTCHEVSVAFPNGSSCKVDVSAGGILVGQLKKHITACTGSTLDSLYRDSDKLLLDDAVEIKEYGQSSLLRLVTIHGHVVILSAIHGLSSGDMQLMNLCTTSGSSIASLDMSNCRQLTSTGFNEVARCRNLTVPPQHTHLALVLRQPVLTYHSSPVHSPFPWLTAPWAWTISSASQPLWRTCKCPSRVPTPSHCARHTLRG